MFVVVLCFISVYPVYGSFRVGAWLVAQAAVMLSSTAVMLNVATLIAAVASLLFWS